MRKIECENLSELLIELRFTPREKRPSQLDAAEKLFGIIDKDTEYPFEFVCFKITGYQPKTETASPLIKGQTLADDLQIFIKKLSSDIGCYAQEQSEEVYTIEELTDDFGVSIRTINRWRKRGLVARKFIFNDGKKRLGFLKSSVDKFLGDNPGAISRAKLFRRLTKKEKQFIIKRARELGGRDKMSRHQVIEKIARQIGRSHEAVRYWILNYERNHPEKKLFKKSAGVINTAQAREIYRLFNQGVDSAQLMKRFDRSKSSIYRIIQMRRAQAILTWKVDFVASDEFLTEDARSKILGNDLSIPSPVSTEDFQTLALADDSLPRYLETIKKSPLLNRQQEVDLFRRYNYLKYLASINRIGLKPYHVSSKKLKRIEDWLQEAETIKKMIIEANLKLVVAIANRHTVSGANLLDLISEGNVSLMNAVEKFDYARGFRFATYASWAITKDYARKIPAEMSRPDRAQSAYLKDVQRDLRTTAALSAEAVERVRFDLIEAIKNNLDEREQYVIINHFGLRGTLVKKEKKTLKQIGDDLGVTKERVRQIELVALQKLRQYLSIEEFELLTG